MFYRVQEELVDKCSTATENASTQCSKFSTTSATPTLTSTSNKRVQYLNYQRERQEEKVVLQDLARMMQNILENGESDEEGEEEEEGAVSEGIDEECDTSI